MVNVSEFFGQARTMIREMAFLKDSLPDGMWDEITDLVADYKETLDKETFVENLNDCLVYWGFNPVM
jgi:hypothetical protein